MVIQNYAKNATINILQRQNALKRTQEKYMKTSGRGRCRFEAAYAGIKKASKAEVQLNDRQYYRYGRRKEKRHDRA